MKNIHVLPKDKPSKLFIYDGRCGLSKENQYGSDAVQNQVIYITNQETMIEGDWFLDTLTKKITKKKQFLKGMSDEKIILTTDQDLIKDGVQAIDDEFLEWFVKNPSCEEVEIEESTLLNTSRTYLDIDKYKIIIPKEEPEQETFLGKTISKKDADKDSFEDVTKYKIEKGYSEEIVDILDNVRYWETCPDSYKVIIERFIEQNKKK